ncbi:MAG: type II toxin-antitoxin system VapC family toxin [Nitrospiraceae bacterium]|nr:type II toxin-antitoxin system VapC family toxin [Nitrospiraceae bacterium]
MATQNRFYLDTNAVIGILERREPLNVLQRKFLLSISEGKTRAFVSEFTLAECVVKPLREGNAVLCSQYAAFVDTQLTAPPLPIDRQVLLLAAEIRAASGVKFPDAIHVASATVLKCKVMLSADKALPLPPWMERCSFEDITRQHLNE